GVYYQLTIHPDLSFLYKLSRISPAALAAVTDVLVQRHRVLYGLILFLTPSRLYFRRRFLTLFLGYFLIRIPVCLLYFFFVQRSLLSLRGFFSFIKTLVICSLAIGL